MQSTYSTESGQLEYIGRYRILEVLGKGAMAIVYKAYDPNIDRSLAIKVLREERCVDTEYRERFLREARAAGNLSHPNIVTVYDVGEFNDRPYIVMEVVEGNPLDVLMKQGKQFSMDEILDICIQLAQALNYAHKNGVVHRDIKPSNIIYHTATDSVKITDFGIAHLESNEMTQQTQAGEVLGTPQYMSPEQVLGQPVDGRSDLFSVGVVMYQMVSGQKPFTGDTIASLLFQIATEDPQPLDKVSHIPGELRLVIEKLLEKQPHKRFQSGEELARTLTRLREDDQEPDAARIIPLRVKWTFIMTMLVGSVLLIGLYFVYQKQYEAMKNQAVDYGGSLTKFIASEAALPLLDDDPVAIQVIVAVAKQRNNEGAAPPNTLAEKLNAKPQHKGDINYITIVDRKSIIRGHNNMTKVGKTYKGYNGGQKIYDGEDMQVIDLTLPSTERVFEFGVPITFKNHNAKIELGHVYIGISQASLQNVISTTIIMMLVLMGSTITAVIVIAYVFGATLARPIQILRRSMSDISHGHMSTRIIQKRQDEFGQLFASFNRMAESLQKQERKSNPKQKHHATHHPDDTTIF